SPLAMCGNCAICQDTWDDVASTLPCGHQFCRRCILQWAQTNPSCPLCRRTMETVRFSDDAAELSKGRRRRVQLHPWGTICVFADSFVQGPTCCPLECAIVTSLCQ
uniref:RING-type E3 ubiquitin transferase n=1 Tax=Zosterops lateralis melanops TaxID=1220523 RepID=A0A8D2PS92_ZOSLA